MLSSDAGLVLTTALINLRPLDTLDEDFSFQVYASTRADEMNLLDWSDGQKTAFLQMQFNAQRQHYKLHYPQAAWQVIEQYGHALGRLVTDNSSAQVFLLMDIAVFPHYRGRGIGTAILQDLLLTASRMHKTVSLHVEPNNRAFNLYQRLGFVACGQSGFYIEMKKPPYLDAAL